MFIVAGVFGGPTVGLLNARNGFQDPGSQSARAESAIERATGAESSPGVLALVAAPPSSPAVAAVAHSIAAVPGVAAVTQPSVRTPGLISRDGSESVVAATLSSTPDPNTVVKRIESALQGRGEVQLGGGDVAGEQVSAQASKDLGFAELLAFPLLALLAALIFRGVAAVLPLAVGGLSVLGAFVVLRVVNYALPLSSFALNLVIGLGLGLAIDYSLLLVWRFREELGGGVTPAQAVRTTVGTAGRTVLFSAVTVACAMVTLTLFPQRFLVRPVSGRVLLRDRRRLAARVRFLSSAFLSGQQHRRHDLCCIQPSELKLGGAGLLLDIWRVSCGLCLRHPVRAASWMARKFRGSWMAHARCLLSAACSWSAAAREIPANQSPMPHSRDRGDRRGGRSVSSARAASVSGAAIPEGFVAVRSGRRGCAH
ncbi:MAG: MMPL family transporter [Solirubrobacteraceae bacterium]